MRFSPDLWIFVAFVAPFAALPFATFPFMTPACGGNQFVAGQNSDASNAAADAGKPFCASLPVHDFCDDFDEGGTVQQGWDNIGPSPAINLTIDSTKSFSPPNSLLANCQSASATADKMLLKSAGTISTLTGEFRVYVDAFGYTSGSGSSPTTYYATIFAADMGLIHYGIQLTSDAVANFFEYSDVDPSARNLYAFTDPILGNRWVRVDVTLTLPTSATAGGTTPHVNIQLDSKQTLDSDLRIFSVRSALSFAIGLRLPQTANPWTVNFDNVLMDWN